MKKDTSRLLATNLLRGNSVVLVLAILRDGPTHGGAIAVEIDRRSAGTIEFKHGTLYPLLHEMEEDGFIVGEWHTESRGRPKRVYTVTETGLVELDSRLKVWREFGDALQRVVEGGGIGG